MENEVQQRVTAFNEVLEQLHFAYRIDIVDPKTLIPADKNARFMSGQMFEQLTDNIKRDGGPTSAPFCWKSAKSGIYHILSGHHRVEAAIAANVELMLIMYTDRELSRQEQIAIQLSHNAISGEDEPTILRELWNEILVIDLKAYSGLDDQVMQSFEPVKIDSLGEKSIAFQEVSLAFFPAEIERLDTVLEQIKKRKAKRYAAQTEQFDRFVDRLMDFKEAAGIYNSATALLAILDIVEAWLAEHADDDEQEESNSGKAE